MAKISDPYIRASCGSCGGPLSPPDASGKIMCEYCGAIYWSNLPPQQTISTQKETRATTQLLPENQYPQMEQQNAQQPLQGVAGSKGIPKWVQVILGVGVIVFISMIYGLFDNSSKDNQLSIDTNPKPVMLEQIPVSPVSAGTIINYSDWGVKVEPEVSVSGGNIQIALEIINYSSEEKIFRYQPNSIKLTDDLGNSYKAQISNCEADLLFMDKQISVRSGDHLKFISGSNWCGSSSTYIPLYSGVLPHDAKKIYLLFEKFGPFDSLKVEIRL